MVDAFTLQLSLLLPYVVAGSWIDVSRAAFLQGRPYCKSSSCADQKNA